MLENIKIIGASEHNLKNISVTIPRNQFVVITGLSGSGKSSLAFDTIYAEGQRRYVESLSAYARQFLDRLQKPKVEHIEGLSPAIAIEQRNAGSSPRSTVATVTEIYDYLRLLYAHAGVAYCPECGRKLEAQSPEKITENLASLPAGKRFMILSPIIDGKKGEHLQVLEDIEKEGFVRVRVDGRLYPVSEVPELDKNKKHSIDIVIDRLSTDNLDKSRLNDSVELALKHGKGNLILLIEGEEKGEFIESRHSEFLACPDCKISLGKLLPRNFSFNAPYGACPECNGLGVLQVMDENLVVPDRSLSINNGAIPAWRRGPRHLIIYYNMILRKLAEMYNYPDMLKQPFEKLPAEIQRVLLYGTGEKPLEFHYTMRGKKYLWSKPFEGILENLRRRMIETESDSVRERLKTLLTNVECPVCKGARLNKWSLAVKVGGLAINEFNALSVEKALDFVNNLQLEGEAAIIAADILKEIRNRLSFLKNVGLNYLTLDRVSGTLSGGEAQRIRLATQLGCGLVGVLYILDEPSIGLHQRDNDKLLDTLVELKNIGNTVLVVEHDLDTIKKADYVLDLGPGAGSNGGEIVAIGKSSEIPNFPKSLTGDFLAGRLKIEVPAERQKGNGKFITIKKAEHNNLKKVDVQIPLGTFTCVTGVSGSGKSSLINGILVKALNKHQKIKDSPIGKCKEVSGLDNINKAIIIDQTPIGRTPRSNPVTYTDAFSMIRNLFAALPESKVRGFTPGRFSFNVKGGRCEDCKGDGIKKIEMQFLSDVYVECSSCHGKRFNQETLNIRYKKKNIADILDMTIDESVEFFDSIPALKRKLGTLQSVGLGYVKLGQSATTLSGGEAQRIKLAAELSKIPKGHTVYILDEPTTGLHLADIKQLLKVLMKLRDKGNTVIVIEHNLDVIKCADHIIDMGPEGGDNGGQVIAEGTPEEVAKVKKSYTGKYLKEYLK